ncbi:hypothetical protein SRHO_G00101780 [Serrasalmus rhombeus]
MFEGVHLKCAVMFAVWLVNLQPALSSSIGVHLLVSGEQTKGESLAMARLGFNPHLGNSSVGGSNGPYLCLPATIFITQITRKNKKEHQKEQERAPERTRNQPSTLLEGDKSYSVEGN